MHREELKHQDQFKKEKNYHHSRLDSPASNI
jgi:hypothetical protein